MKDDVSNVIKKAFNNFWSLLETRIKNENTSYYDNECYLIDNNWYNELEKNIRDYENNLLSYNNKKFKKINKPELLIPKKFPDFIDNINKAIEFLKAKIKPKLISKNVLNSIYKKEELKNINMVKYFSGFNNLIIMFKGKEDNNGLFLFNPLKNKNKTNNIIFSFAIKNKKNDNFVKLYTDLLQMKNKINETLIDNLIKNKTISHYKIIKENEEISYDTREYLNNNLSGNILKIFISIFYYEKSLSSNMDETFINSQNFSLINPDWFIELKNNYNYEIMHELLSSYDNNNKINYSNLDKEMNDILLYAKNEIKIDKIKLPEKLMKGDFINPPTIEKNKICYYDKCYIIPFKLMNSIKEYLLENNIAIESKEIISQANDIYIIDSHQILFGRIDDTFLFITEYIFSYDSIDILNHEKQIINSTSIIEYIQQRNFNLNDSSLQELWDKKFDKKIGNFITLNINSKIEQKNIIKEDKSKIKVNRINEKKINKINNNIRSSSTRKRKISNFDNNVELRELTVNKKRKDFPRKINSKYNSINYETEISTLKYEFEGQNNLKKLKNKIEDLERDNKNKKKELNKYITLINEKEEYITKINEDNILIRKELENVKEKNNEINYKLQMNKNEIKSKEEEISRLKVMKGNEKDKYEILLAQLKEENNKLKTKNEEILKEKENEFLKFKKNIKNHENKETKLKKMEEIELNKENNKLNEKKKELEKEINKKKKEYEKILILIENKKKEIEEINSKEYRIKKKEEELKNKEKEINKKEKEINNKEKEIKVKEEKMNESKTIQELKLEKSKEVQMDILNENNKISKSNDEDRNIKLNYEKKIKNLNQNLNDNNLKIKNLEKKIQEINRKNEMLIKSENDCKRKIKEYENQIKIFKNENNNLNLISEREKEINNKISFLEDKENLIEKEMIDLNKEKIENQRIKQENNNLFEINKNLIKEIEEKQQIYNQILSNIEEKDKKQKLKNISQNKILFNSVNENQKLSLKNEYEKEPILVGLNNIGATCFMNSVLQCLSQTKPLTDYFLNDKNLDKIFNNNIKIKNKNELQLSPVYYELIKQLWDKKGAKSFSPNNFMNQVEKMNPLFKKGQAGDSKDFIIFIFEQLHKELKRPIGGEIKEMYNL